MNILFILLVLLLALLSLVALAINLLTGRNPFDVIEDAAFIYGLHRRQYMRGRWDAIKETWKDMT